MNPGILKFLRNVIQFQRHTLCRLIYPFLFAFFLGACNQYAVRGPVDEASPHYTFPVGTIFVLHEALVISPGYARVFFQNGGAGSAINEYAPHCELEVRQVLPVAQTVRPDEFVINRVSYDILEVVEVQGLLLAQGGGDSVSDIMQAWVMRLHSDRQPNVLKLLCAGALNHPGRAKSPSIAQIRAALGNYASFRLP